MSVPDSTAKEYRLSRSILVLGVVCLVFFLGMMAATTWIIVNDAPPDWWRKMGLAILSFGTWGTMSLLAVWMVLAGLREKLQLSDEGIWQRTALFTHAAAWKEIDSLRWHHIPAGGSTVLRSGRQKFTIYLQNFPRAERIEIIRALRECVPTALQQDWEAFCYRVALPLRTGCAALPAHMESGTFHRWHWDVTLIPVQLVFGAASIYLASAARTPQLYIIPPVLLAMWLWLRYSVPRAGKAVVRRKLRSSEKKFIVSMGAWCLVCLGSAGLIERNLPQVRQEWRALIGFGVLFITLIPLMAHSAWQTYAEEREENREAGPKADQKWRMLEQCERATA